MRSRVAFSAVVLTGLAFSLAGCSAQYAGDTEHIDSFAVDYTIAPSGVIHTVETIHYDFAGESGKHGIFRYLYSHFPGPHGQDRIYDYTNIQVTSPSGASALFSTATQSSVEIKVGNANATLMGKQTYVISYDIRGALNATKQTDGSTLDEFYWNVTGYDWPVGMNKITVAIHSPSSPSLTACYQGAPGSTALCPTQSADGSGARFATGFVPAGQGLTVDAGWPAGTFSQTAPILAAHLPADAPVRYAGSNDGPDPFWTPWNWGTGLALLVLIPLGYLLLVTTRRRDLEFTGATPGTVPMDQANAPVGTAPMHETLVVEYQPPAGFPVGAANLLLTKQRRTVDITATLIDLAVRHHLRIEEIGDVAKRKAKDYNLVATPELVKVSDPKLFAHETLLLDKLFAGGRKSVTLSALNNTFSTNLTVIKAAIDSWVDAGKYFADRLHRSHPVLGWTIALSIAVFIGMFFVDKAWAFIPVGAFIGAVIALAQGQRAVRRSALGHAIFIQLEGFRMYIGAAEADQIRFEEGTDVFSRYMPWAIAFGQAEHWARVFASLAEKGSYTATPDWYVGNFATLNAINSIAAISSIGAAVSSFSAVANAAMSSSPATVSSGGGTGFSSFGGGGGFSGGGGGGGGGGSW
jgi:uncharacterized membrane protein YgcG